MSLSFSVAIVENAHEETHTLKLVPGKDTVEMDKELLKLNKKIMPRLVYCHPLQGERTDFYHHLTDADVCLRQEE